IKTTVYPNSSKDSASSPAVPASPKVSPTSTPVEIADDDMKLHPSGRSSVKVTNLMHFMEYSLPKVVPARLISEPTLFKQ
ncbi:unnamed protein product, partial [Hymenolepis diminuta]